MKNILFELQQELKRVSNDLNSATPQTLKIYARELARIEMLLQAARSMLEARVFEAEIDNEKALNKQLESK